MQVPIEIRTAYQDYPALAAMLQSRDQAQVFSLLGADRIGVELILTLDEQRGGGALRQIPVQGMATALPVQLPIQSVADKLLQRFGETHNRPGLSG
jgi:hypothetical protein